MKRNNLTIIIATYNCAEKLKYTLEDIRLFKNNDIQIVIVDGASRDGTVEIIKNNLDIVKNYITEPDTGIYSAWNKSIKLINTDFFMFLGAGDTTTKEFINEFQNIKNATKIDLIFGNYYIIKSTNKKYINTSYLSKILPEALKKSMCIAHPALIHNSRLVKENKFNENFKICSDWFFLYESNINITFHIDKIQCFFEMGGISTKFKSRPTIFREILKFMHSKNRFPSSRHMRDIMIYYIFFTSEKLYNFVKFFKEKQ